jgi:O-acetyl-ADP-ribose deacetylase (regulator of RNase III)
MYNSFVIQVSSRCGNIISFLYKAIIKLNVDAIVNAANDDKLANIGGVAEVIERAAGSQMKRECEAIIRTKRKVQEGNNVTTSDSRSFFFYSFGKC